MIIDFVNSTILNGYSAYIPYNHTMTFVDGAFGFTIIPDLQMFDSKMQFILNDEKFTKPRCCPYAETKYKTFGVKNDHLYADFFMG